MKKIWGIGLVAAAALLLTVAYVAVSEDDDEGGVFSTMRDPRPDVAPVTNALYAKECGACHFAYQPGLLPADSWRRLMNNLSDHFGDNAELAPEVQRTITDYLAEHAADRAGERRSMTIMRSLRGEAPPLRITEVPYIRRRHHELPSRLVRENPRVMSLGNCSACHTRAKSGVYDEDTVNIPGFGRWDD
jgi:hypothetical protein